MIPAAVFFQISKHIMPGNEIFHKAWNKMVFEGRNTEYGAYKMRSQTGKRYTIALGCLGAMFLLTVVPVVITMILMAQKPKANIHLDKVARMEGVRIKEARPQRRPEKKSEPQQSDKTDELTDMPEVPPDVLVVDEEEVIDPEQIVDLKQDSLQVLLNEQHLDLAKKEERTDGVVVDTIPLYPGGISAYMKWLDSVMVYPPACVRRKIQGTVLVAFIVDVDGSTKEPHIIQGSYQQLNSEALRVMHLMRPWKPARKHGCAIRSQVTVPVVFTLE